MWFLTPPPPNKNKKEEKMMLNLFPPKLAFGKMRATLANRKIQKTCS